MNQSTTELGEQKALISKFQFGIMMDTSKTLALTSREAYDNKVQIFFSFFLTKFLANMNLKVQSNFCM
jgi:hypothetical protein